MPVGLIRGGATAAALIYALGLALAGIRPNEHTRYFTAYTPAVIGLAAVAFDRWLWRWPGIHRLAGRPRIDGTWHAELRPHPDSRIPRGGNRGPIRAYMVIEQTYWSLHAVLMTAESSSSSRTAAVRGVQDSQRKLLEFTYVNDPRLEHQPRSRSHAGTCTLTITERLPQTMSGHYWTDRLTAGGMDLTYLDRATGHASFAAIRQAQAGAGSAD